MAGKVPQDLDQLIAILRRSISGVGITGDVSSAISIHAVDADAHHNWPLLDGDIPAAIARDSEVTSAIATHTANASAHHAPVTIGSGNLSAKLGLAGQQLALGSIAHTDLTITGAAWNVVGLTATNTPGLILPSAAPGAAEKILKTDSAGELQLSRFKATAITGSLIPELTDTYDLGSATKLWRKGWLSELESILFVENTISVIGGWFMVPHGQGTLAADVGAGDTTVNFGQSMTVSDFVIMRGNLAVEYLKVVSPASGTTYNVTRDLDGSGANDWPAGQVFVILGNTGDGRIEFDAQTGGPRISVFEQGATYNAQTERVRIGDMAGWGSYSGYGIGIGDPAGNRIAYTPTTGLQIVGDGGSITNINGGNIQTNTITATQIAATTITAAQIAANTITATQIAANTITATEISVSTLSAISANMGTITAGTITAATIRTAASGARIELNSTRIFGTNGTTTQWEALGSDGKISAGAGRVLVDVDGITIIKSAISSDLWSEAYKFVRADGSTKIGGVRSIYTSTQNLLYLSVMTPNGAGYSTGIVLEQLSTHGLITVGAYGTGSSVLVAGENINLQANNIASSKITASTNYLHISGGGLAVNYAADPGDGNILYTDSLISRKNANNYTGYIYVPKVSASYAWSGVTRDAATTYTVTYSQLGIPLEAKAALIRWAYHSASTHYRLRAGYSSTDPGDVDTTAPGIQAWARGGGIVNMTAAGNMYFRSDGASTTNGAYLYCLGYWI